MSSLRLSWKDVLKDRGLEGSKNFTGNVHILARWTRQRQHPKFWWQILSAFSRKIMNCWVTLDIAEVVRKINKRSISPKISFVLWRFLFKIIIFPVGLI